MAEYKILEANTPELKKKLFAIRQEVFVVEQAVDPDEEFDEFEDTSTHFVVLDANDHPIGSARWRETKKGIKLERFAVKATRRGDGIGGTLVQAVLDSIEKTKGSGNLLYMHAQLKAIPLYERFGFHKKGELFEECNILHYTMEKIN